MWNLIPRLEEQLKEENFKMSSKKMAGKNEGLVDSTAAYTPIKVKEIKKRNQSLAVQPISSKIEATRVRAIPQPGGGLRVVVGHLAEISPENLKKSVTKKEAPKKDHLSEARKISTSKSMERYDAWFEKYQVEIIKEFKAGTKKSEITKHIAAKEVENPKMAAGILYYVGNRLGLFSTKNAAALVARHDALRKALKNGKK